MQVWLCGCSSEKSHGLVRIFHNWMCNFHLIHWMVYRYLECRKESVACTTGALDPAVSVECSLGTDKMSALWTISYKNYFENSVPMPHFPPNVTAKCTKGCYSGTDCRYGEECSAFLAPRCSPIEGCPFGSCSPLKCSFSNEAMGGVIVKNKDYKFYEQYGEVGKKYVFRCYYYNIHKKYQTRFLDVQCQVDPIDSMPVSLTSSSSTLQDQY